jgi:Ca2+-binding RTX toxin-like protein
MSTFFEGLENRQLMSVSLSNGVLRVTGSNNADNVMIDQDASTIYVFENNILTKLAPVTQVNAIAFDAYGGDDKFKAFPAVTKNITVYAGAGNDNVETGSGNDLVLLGLGNDYGDGGAGADNMDGNDGNDTMVGGLGNDTMSGALGIDIVYGGGDNDVLYGSDGTDYLMGDAGSDTLFGGAGNDTLNGGLGIDMVYGETGNDFFYAKDKTRDYLNGGDGYDGGQVDKGGWSSLFVTDLMREMEYTI